MPAYDAKLSSRTLHLESAGTIRQMLFNQVPVMGIQYLIVSPADYEQIKADIKNGLGQIHLLSFKDWQKTGGVIHKLNQTLAQYNREHTEAWYDNPALEEFAFQASSRWGEYRQWLDSGRFGIIIISFVSALFYAASCAVLHFGVMSEFEAERHKYRKLRGIGITAKEASDQIRRPIRNLFFLPYLLSVPISGFFYIYIFSMEVQGARAIGFMLLAALLVSVLFIIIQLLIYILYTSRYTRRLLKAVEII